MKKIVFALVLLGVVGGGFAWWKTTHQKARIEVLAASTVQRGTVRKVLEETGIIKSQVGAIVKIGARATGTMERMLVKVGDHVEKGAAGGGDRQPRTAIPARRSPGPSSPRRGPNQPRVSEVYPLQIREAQAKLAQARARPNTSQNNFRRQQDLFKQGFISRDEAGQRPSESGCPGQAGGGPGGDPGAVEAGVQAAAGKGPPGRRK